MPQVSVDQVWMGPNTLGAVTAIQGTDIDPARITVINLAGSEITFSKPIKTTSIQLYSGQGMGWSDATTPCIRTNQAYGAAGGTSGNAASHLQDYFPIANRGTFYAAGSRGTISFFLDKEASMPADQVLSALVGQWLSAISLTTGQATPISLGDGAIVEQLGSNCGSESAFAELG